MEITRSRALGDITIPECQCGGFLSGTLLWELSASRAIAFSLGSITHLWETAKKERIST